MISVSSIRVRHPRSATTSAAAAQACRQTREGFTLVEVVVGLTLLAILLVGIVRATSAHRRTIARAEDRIEATRVADRLLASLPDRGGRYAVPMQGRVPGRSSWSWSMTRTSTQRLVGVPVETLQFRIVDAGLSELVTVDLVQALPLPKPEPVAPNAGQLQ